MYTVIEKLNSIIKHKKISTFEYRTDSDINYPFIGELSGNYFVVVRNIDHNAAKPDIVSGITSLIGLGEPEIEGEIFNEDENTTILISIQIPLPNIIILCGSLILPFMVFCIGICNFIVELISIEQINLVITLLVPLTFILIPLYIFLRLYFRIVEAFKSIKIGTEIIFNELLEAELI